jgi:hypothetical protein
LAKKLSFQPDLDYIYNIWSKNDDEKLVEEVTTLFANFNENKNENKTEKILFKELRLMKQALNKGDEGEVNKCWV